MTNNDPGETTMVMRTTRRAALLGGAVLATPALAQEFPTRPVRMLVTWPPGGTTDILARQFQPRLSALLGQPVVVENRGGASGAIGAAEMARMNPDGHGFGMVTSTVISAALLTRQPYDPIRDLAPIINLARVANILVVHPSLPVNNVQELIALARAQPGRLTFGSPGIGSAVHISGEMFKLAANVDMVHAPYRGGGPALADLVSGHIQLMFGNASSTLPFVRDGSLRAIAVTSATRAAYLPNVPTVAEQGLPGFAIEEWYACLGPAGMNPRAVERINAAFNTVIAEPAERARLLEMGAEVVGGTAEEFGRFYRAEVEKIAAVVRDARIRVE
ncbi:tripartite tricarboxylate transporter substrate binding protein [Roseococcus sp. SDR]|uniref:Bug family tripartite tricarboxylate transporter substrate binding protein n=1 Tax=Roseococcus sp. SDR TaxID=2835532 RepID=UPI001BCE8BD9|nr:tripartite tricarboxylate transporter substrate binding protein [Roseococcus sp. SDR]MBS7789785.1 tripartite tricarboxylate transporter substrate binding protein [Roseococcus sp. SDR]MBV1845099.1 tripartite tricarboxylate transporter substrate binding protein [Roseococcus sp. SDR]